MGMVAPYDAALLSDLELLDTARYKLVLVLNAFRLESRQQDILRCQIAGRDRTVIWYYAPGYFDQLGCDVANIQQVTGIHVVTGAPGSTGTKARLLKLPGVAASEIPLLDASQFVVDAESATDGPIDILGTRSDNQQVVVARRRQSDWTSIYSAVAPLPAGWLKQIAADAGVHIFDQSPAHLLMANRNYLVLGADDRGGDVSIQLAAPGSVCDAISGQKLGTHTDHFLVKMRPKEVRLFSLQTTVRKE